MDKDQKKERALGGADIITPEPVKRQTKTLWQDLLSGVPGARNTLSEAEQEKGITHIPHVSYKRNSK